MKIEIIENGVSEIREMTKSEKDYAMKRKAVFEEQLALEQAEAEAKATAKSAIADRLGLTADELQVLLG